MLHTLAYQLCITHYKKIQSSENIKKKKLKIPNTGRKTVQHNIGMLHSGRKHLQ